MRTETMEKKNAKNRLTVLLIGAVCLLVLALGSTATVLHFFSKKAAVMYLALLVGTCGCAAAVLHFHRFFTEKILRQLAIILYFFDVFLISALISPYPIRTNVKWIAFDTAVLAVVNLTVFLLYRRLPASERPIAGGRVKAFFSMAHIRENLAILAALLLLLIERIPLVGLTQRWDAGEYYYWLGIGCQNFDFSFGAFLEHFQLCRHPTYGISLILAPGEFLNQHLVYGTMLISLGLTIAAGWCIYRLFLGFFTKTTKVRAAIAAFFCMSLPLIWGTFGYFNPDYFIAIFFIFFLYSEFRGHYLTMIFWGVMTSQCKETGIIIIFSYAIFRVFTIFVTAEGGFGKKIMAQIRHLGNWAALAVGMSYIVYAIRSGGLTSWKQTGSSNVATVSWSSGGMNTFGFQPSYIIARLQQFFVMNFAWLIWGGILVCAVLLIARCIKIRGTKSRRKQSAVQCGFESADAECSLHFSNLVPVLGAMALYAAFNCIYVTSCIYRYHVFFVLFTAVVFAALFLEVMKDVKLPAYAGLMGALCVILGIQTFATVDPVSLAVIPTVETGKGRMLFSSNGSSYYGDFLVYNYQYTWIDQAINDLFDEIDYDPETQIVLAGSEIAGTHLEGNGWAYRMFWNPERRVRTMVESEDTYSIATVGTGVLGSATEVPYVNRVEEIKSRLHPKSAVIFFPYYGEDEQRALDILENYYEIGERRVIREHSGELIYYPLTKLPVDDRERLRPVLFPNGTVDASADPEEWEIEWQIRQMLIPDVVNQPLSEMRDTVRFGDAITYHYTLEAEGYDVTEETVGWVSIGESLFLPEIEQKMIGLRVGEPADISFTFPKYYENAPELSGKTGVMHLTVESIDSELPTFTDEMVQTVLGADSAEALRAQVREELTAAKEDYLNR